MADTSWVPVIGAAVGAAIALAGTVVNTVRTDRTQRRRDRESERLSTYVDFALALHDAHSGLRDVARGDADLAQRAVDAGEALENAKIYGVRERLLMSGTTGLVQAGETAFLRLIGIRDAVRGGAALSGTEYHQAYHAFAEAIWTFRIAVRQEVSQRPITPADLGRVSWSEREQCPVCGQPTVPG